VRDDFPAPVKESLSKRVAHRCSRPGCGQLTCGPQEDPEKALNVGVAAHITGASPAGPRYDPSLTNEQRQSAGNGIWLCQTCAKLIDNDQSRYSVLLLNEWKGEAEKATLYELLYRKPNIEIKNNIFIKVSNLMPGLLLEMHNDLEANPFRREFVILSKRGSYWAGGNEFMYYFEDHPELEGKVRILMNYNLVEDITSKNVSRYVMSEELVDFLSSFGH
jgi:hypothetical protein